MGRALWENPPNSVRILLYLVVLMKRLKLAAVCALALAGLTATAAGAQTDPYVSGTTGYDVSYPNCSATPPTTAAFAVVGVNGGRPFTTNSCLGTEYTTATRTGSVSLYINTAYSGAYKRNITATCTTLVPSGLAGSAAQAWEIGCSEADTSLGYAGGRTAAMWWLDVETGNSWSSSSLALNQDAIWGAAGRLKAAGAPAVGVYSTSASWTTITGTSYTPPNTDAEWVAGGSCTTPFDGNPVWLSQHGAVGGVDSDLAC